MRRRHRRTGAVLEGSAPVATGETGVVAHDRLGRSTDEERTDLEVTGGEGLTGLSRELRAELPLADHDVDVVELEVRRDGTVVELDGNGLGRVVVGVTDELLTSGPRGLQRHGAHDGEFGDAAARDASRLGHAGEDR